MRRMYLSLQYMYARIKIVTHTLLSRVGTPHWEYKKNSNAAQLGAIQFGAGKTKTFTK